MNAVLNIATQPTPSQKVGGFLKQKPRLFIGGEWVEPLSGKFLSVFDPATGQEIAQVAAAGVWTSNLSAARRLVPRIKAGTVWVNCHNYVDPNMPFGGYKQSGFGREHGRVAVEMYTEQKSVCIAI